MVLNQQGEECPQLIKRAYESCSGVVEWTKKFRSPVFVLIDGDVYELKWVDTR
jgi:hypothetical protein